MLRGEESSYLFVLLILYLLFPFPNPSDLLTKDG